jgi:hypothetical protein
MVKKMIIVIIVFMLFIVLIIPVDAQIVVDPAIDEELMTFAERIASVELQSLRDFGRYTQILTVSPDVATGTVRRLPCPADDLICPTLALTLTTLSVTTNVYQTPGNRPGYEIVAEYVDRRSGYTMRRVINQGPEVWRARAWEIVPPDDLGVTP